LAKKSTGGRYYYAGGKKVELAAADDLVAVDERALAAAAVPEAVGNALRKSVQSLSGGVALLNRADLGAHAAAAVLALEAAGATHPVYRSQGALVVVLPEVRVEETRGAQRKHLTDWLASHAHETVVTSRSADRLVLEPKSGQGGDALTLANELTEQVGPELAQARFLRVVPGPSTRRT
jgi:hypothetical protein